MLIGIVQTPAPAPPAVAGAAVVPSGDAPAFDATLDAATLDASAAPATNAPAAEPPVRRFADPLSLAEWMLIGVPQEEPVADALSEPLSGMADGDGGEDESAPAAPATKGDAWWDIPIDALLTPPVPVQDLPLRSVEPASSESGDIVVNVTPTVEQVAAMASAPSASAPVRTETPLVPAPPKEEFGASLDEIPEPVTAAGVRSTPPPPRTAPKAPKMAAEPPAVAPGEIQAAPATPDTIETEAGEPPVRLDRRPAVNVGSARNGTPAVRGSQQGPAAPVQAPAAPEMSAAASAVAQQAASAAAAAVPAESSVRDNAAAQRPGAFVQASQFENESGNLNPGGQDASSGQNFAEAEARRSPAAVRLAAALAAAPVEGTNANAPVFSVPTPAAAVTPTAAAPIVAPAPAADMTPEAENVQKLIQTMRIAAKSGGWEATVRLKPEHLGEVSISLRVDGSSVSAMVHAEASGVRQWLRAQEDSVRSGLAEQGLQLDRFVVDQDGGREQQEQAEEQRQRRAPRRAAVPTERFEIVV